MWNWNEILMETEETQDGKVGLLGNVVKFEFKMSFGTFIKQGKYFLLLKIKHQYHCCCIIQFWLKSKSNR